MANVRVYRLVYEVRPDGRRQQTRRTDNGPGNWFLDYSDQFGRRHREATKATTKREAEALGRERMSAIVKAQIIGVNCPEALSMAFEDFVNDVFLPHAKATCRLHTYENYVHYAARAIPAFRRMNMRAIQDGDVQRFLDKLTTDGKTRYGHKLAPATVNRVRAFLVAAFYEAKRGKYVTDNPAAGTRKLHEDNERRRYASEWEEKQVMTHAAAWLRPIIKIGTLAGLRMGEIISLKWDQVDKAREVLRVPPACKGHKWREVPITRDLWPWLREVTPFVNKDGQSPYVFVDVETAKPYRKYRIQNAFESAIRLANITITAAARTAGSKRIPIIEDLHFHDTRRTFASRLAQAGVSLQTIAELLGHSATYVTERYAYLQPENLRAAVAMLSKPAPAKKSGKIPASSKSAAAAKLAAGR